MTEKTKKKTQVKYTPPKDKTIPEELKKEKPLSSAATALEDIESTLPKSTRKSSGSDKSLSKIQDDLDKGDITPEEAQDKAGIKEDKGRATPSQAHKILLLLQDTHGLKNSYNYYCNENTYNHYLLLFF